jgi:hypothetical protein
MYKKSHLFLGVVLLLSIETSAQQFIESTDNTPNLERHQLTLNIINPGFKYELGLFKNVSLSSGVNTALASYSEGYSFGFAWHTQIRYYHNFKRRYDLKKNVMGNSANFVSFARTAFFQPIQLLTDLDYDKNSSIIFYGLTYGLQRTNINNFNITAELGYGYYDAFGVFPSPSSNQLANGRGFLLNITFGWVPTNRKSRMPPIILE